MKLGPGTLASSALTACHRCAPRCAAPPRTRQMGLSAELCRALAEMQINTPTAIQKVKRRVKVSMKNREEAY